MKPFYWLITTCFLFSQISYAEQSNLREHSNNRFENHSKKHMLKAGDYTFYIEHAGEKRKYQMHVPKSYNATKPVPLVLSLHGGGGNMQYQAGEEYYHWISKSEAAGFIAVFPNGYSRLRSGKLATWNAGICCGIARDKKIDDLGFIRAVVGDVNTRANIDPQRVFANGMSNGGMMSYRLACEASDIFRAIASVTGTDGTLQCAPSKAMPVFHIHAKNDDRVLFNGGSGSKSDTHADFVSVPDTIAKWVKHNACEATPKRVLEVQDAYCELYSGCRDNAQVKLCVTETGGHSWPGGKKVRGGKAGSTAINATDLIWEFYNQY
jgi:polyhydroxybutyrate depolymerase